MQTLKASRLVQTLFLVGLLIVAFNSVQAQNNTSGQPTPTPIPAPAAQPAASPSPTPDLSPKVTEVTGNLQLDDIVEVKVENLEKWSQAAEANEATKLVPYINGRAIRGNYPEELHLETGRLI